MSTDYIFNKDISKKKVLSAMKKLGLEDAKADNSSKTSFCITNGECYLWCYTADDGSWVNFTRYGGNYDAEDEILVPLADELQVDFYSEYDDEYAELMGFDEEEEESGDIA